MVPFVDSGPRIACGRHDPCTESLVGNDARLKMAIRTVAVTTRVAVASHERRGDPDLAIASAERGLELLEDIGKSLDDDASTETMESFAAVHRELTALASPRRDARPAFSIGADDSPVEEDVDVGSKLRP